MNYIEVIEGLCKVCAELAETLRLAATTPEFPTDEAEARLAQSSARYKELTGDELLEGR